MIDASEKTRNLNEVLDSEYSQLVQVFDGHLEVDRSPDSEFTAEVSMRLQPGGSGYALERSDDS